MIKGVAGGVYVGRQKTMRALRARRFVVYGAVGFGIGWAIVGFFNSIFIAMTAPMFPPGRGAVPTPWWLTSPPELSWFFAGASGDAALGMPIVGIDWEQPPLLLLAYVLVMVGIIEGASLGAILGYLERRKLVRKRGTTVR